MALGMLYGLSSAAADMKAMNESYAAQQDAKAKAAEKQAELDNALNVARISHPSIKDQVEQLRGLPHDELSKLLMYGGRKTPGEIDSNIFENYGQGEQARANADKSHQETLNLGEQQPWIGPKAQAEIKEKESSTGENIAQQDKAKAEAALARKRAMMEDLKGNTPYDQGGIGENAGAADEYQYNLLPPDEQKILMRGENEDPGTFSNEISQVWEYANKTGNENLKAGIRHVLRQNPDVSGEAINPNSSWNKMQDPLQALIGQ